MPATSPRREAAREAGDQAEAAAVRGEGRAIIEAVREGARAVVRTAERQAAYIRTGHHGGGQGQWRDAKGLTAAVFVQHTSRDGDPQLHAHIAILNRAQRADGEDDRLAHAGQPVAAPGAAGYRRVRGPGGRAEAAGGRVPRWSQREDGNGAEIGGVTQATMRGFSVAADRDHPGDCRGWSMSTRRMHGHAPSRRALWSLRQWATLQTRKSKHEVRASPRRRIWPRGPSSRRAEEVQVLADVHQAAAQFAAGHGRRDRS